MSESIDQNIQPPKHAKLSASGSARWLSCPGSVAAEEGYRNTSSVHAQTGTRAHEVADLCLKSGRDADFYLGKKVLGKTVDEDMVRAVQQYLDYVRAFETSSSQLFTEERVDFSHLVPEGFGTLDAAIVDFDKRVCQIFDYKHGRVFVGAENNTQGQLYALGLLHELEYLEAIDTFVINIIQPNAGNYGSWEISVSDLKTFGKYVEKQAKTALSANAPRRPSDSACMWCKAKADCPALFEHTQEVIGNEFEDLDKEVLSKEQKRLILDNKSLIDSFLKAVEADIEQSLLNGEQFPGYKLVEGRSNRKYKDTAEAYLIGTLGEEAYKKSLISLTAAEKLVDRETLAEHIYKPRGGPKLVPESAKGIAIVNITDQFSDLEE